MCVALLVFLPSVLAFQVPSWNTTFPNLTVNASAGLPLLSNTVFTVYNTTLETGDKNQNGTYNHGPIITKYEGYFYCSWYNSPQNESQYMRVLLGS